MSPAFAAQVSESDSEFFSSGDFNGDGIKDVLVLDKVTGNARVGYQNAGGALTWSAPLQTGVGPASALAVGRFGPTNREVVAVTSETFNRIHVVSLSNSAVAPTPFALNPPHADTRLLVGLDAPYGSAGSRSWLSIGSSDPGIMLIDLFEFLGDSIAGFADQIAAEGYLDSASSFRRTASDATLLALIRRGTSNDTFVAYAYTNTASPVLLRPNLPLGVKYVAGHFHNEPNPRLLFYVPGQSNVIVQPLTNSAGVFSFGPETVNTFTSAVQRVYFVDEGTNGMAVIHFGDGLTGMRPPAGNGVLQTVYQFGAGAAANANGIVPLSPGRFVLLSRNSNSVASVSAEVLSKSGASYSPLSSSTLPPLTSSGTRGNVWLFQVEPFLSSAANLIGSLNAPVWSSAILGFPDSLSMRVESDAGITSGLGNPTTNSFGAPPSGTGYALPNQYRADMSFFGYAPPIVPEPSVITIAPPPGSYSAPLQVSFTKQNAADDVFYRVNMAAWQNYSSPFSLTNDAAIEYYGQALSGQRSRTQLAFYDLGSTNPPPEPLIDLDGDTGTNQPPLLSTNFLQISANGTVFFSRRSPLAEQLGFSGPSSYLTFAQSPFVGTGFSYFYLETFEDGLFNVPGATVDPGWIVAGPGVDSVEPGGRSYYSAGQTTLTITFNAATLGGKLPTHAGIVWTDVGQTTGAYGVGNVIFSATDGNGISLGSVQGFNLGDFQASPAQGEDRFFGVVNPGGILSITITMPTSSDWEIDHVQYGHLDANAFNGSIWAINLDGSGETFITRGHRPRVTKDGKRMAFLRNGPAGNTYGNIWLRDLQTGLETPFFTNVNSQIVGLDWRTSQTDLVFDYGCSLWTRSLGGAQSSVPFPTDCFADAPVANPIDDRLAFHVLGPNGPPGLYTTPPSWTAPTQLQLPNSGWRWPAWSPNGMQLLMADGDFSTVENRGTNLWIVNADGSNLRQITALVGATNGFPRGAIWKPDASCLVGAGRIGGTNGLWVIPIASNGESCHCPPRLLPTSPGDPIDFAGSIAVAQPALLLPPSGLFIRLEPTAAVVYWSTDFEGFALEYTTDLANPVWVPITGPYFLNGNYYEYRETRTGLAPAKYFRLRYQGVVILTPPNPQMSLATAGNQLVLNWPLSYVGFTVEMTTNLTSGVWQPVNGPYSVTNGVFELRRNLPGVNAAEFYRLRW